MSVNPETDVVLWEIEPGAHVAIERSLGRPNVECPSCFGTGWVCENHPDKAWDHPNGCECGAGKPCRCRPGAHNRREGR